jgi:hypothetical protein
MESFKNASKVSVSDSSVDTLYTAPSLTTSIVLGVAIANKTSNVVAVTLSFTDTSASTTTQMIPAVQIPANTTLEVLAGQKYILEAGDSLKALASVASAIDITMGVLELS